MTRRTPWSGLEALTGIDRRSERAVAVSVGLMLFTVAALFTAAPRMLERAEAESLERSIAEASVAQLRLSIRAIDNFPPGSDDDPLELQRGVVDRVGQELPSPVGAVYGPPRIIADTNRFVIELINGEAPASPSSLTFRIDPALGDNSTIVAGAAAAPTDEMVDGMRVVEFEISTATSEVMGLAVGDEVDLSADTSDAATRRYEGGLPDPFVGRVVGVRELTEFQDPYWFGDARMHRPLVADTGLGASFSMFGAVPDDVLPLRPFLVDERSPFVVEQRRDLRAEAIDVNGLPELLDGLEALDASTVSVPSPGRPAVAVALRHVLAAEAEQQVTARAALVLAGTGVLGVALVAVAQALQVGFARRRPWLAVARVRGASSGQIVAANVIEVAMLATVAVAGGSIVVRLLLGGSTTEIETRLLATLIVGSVVTAAALAAAEVRTAVGGGLSKWGRICGALVVAAAAGCVVTFRRRGFSDEAGIDALVVLLPILVPLACVFLTRWVLPAALRQLARSGLRLGPGRLVGLRRATDEPDAGLGLVAVLALALTVAALGAGVSRSLSDGIVDASWAEARAPLRVDTRDPAVIDAVKEIEGIELAEIGDSQFRLERSGDTFNVRLINVETAALDLLVANTSADLRLPDQLLVVAADGAVPVVAAERIGGQRVRRGDVFNGSGSTADVVFSVIEVRSEAFGRDGDWVIADRRVFEDAVAVPSRTSSLLFDVHATQRAAVTNLVAEADLALVVRADIERQQRNDPLVGAVRRGYLAASAAALALALLAVVGLCVVTARRRRREVAVLGLLGAPAAEMNRAVRWELLPPVAAGTVLGTALGWFITTSFDGRFDLSSFASGTRVEISAAVGTQLVVALMVMAAAFVIIVVLSIRIVRASVDDVLRSEGAS